LPGPVTKEEAQIAKKLFDRELRGFHVKAAWQKHRTAAGEGALDAEPLREDLENRITAMEKSFRKKMDDAMFDLYRDRRDMHPMTAQARKEWWGHWGLGKPIKWRPPMMAQRAPARRLRGAKRGSPLSEKIYDRVIQGVGYAVPPGPLGMFVGYLSVKSSDSAGQGVVKVGRGTLPMWMNAVIDAQEFVPD